MPKRRSEETKEERWKRKMKRYEQKLEGKRRARIIYSEDEDDVTMQECPENDSNLLVDRLMPAEHEGELEIDVAAGTSAEVDPVPSSTDEAGLTAEEMNEDDDFDPQLLQALGNAESDAIEYGDDLHADLANRFQKILLVGLSKDAKDEILKKYPYPKNLAFAKGPTLNPEIGAMLVETCKLRDKRLLVKQDQIGKSLSVLGKAMTSLMKKNSDIAEVIRMLNDAGRLLADSHYAETDTRQSVIIPLIDKSLTESFKDRKRDSLLFGQNLGDLVKNSRGIKKTSQLIQASVSSNVNLNGKGSSFRGARNQRGAGGQTYNRAGGPRPMTSYQYQSNRRRPVPLPPPPQPRRQPAPQPRRQPPQYAQRYPAPPTHRKTYS